jgi:hypothetical protein
MMQSVEEHQETPTEDAVAIPVEEPKKRRRVQKLAAKHRQKPKKRNRGFCGSRKRVTVAGRRTSCHATVAWLKRKLFRRSGTQEHCGSRMIFAAASRGMARCAGVTQWQEIRPGQCGTRHRETTKGREETVETSRMQQGPKGPRPETAATRPRHKTAIGF